MRQCIWITMDAEPNTMRNRFIRLIEHWDTIKTIYKIKTDRDMLRHIVQKMFGELGYYVTEDIGDLNV